MNRLILGIVFALVFALPAYGRVMYTQVTPDNLEKDKYYLFSVTGKESRDGVDFHVTITSEKGDIPPDATAYMEICTFSQDGDMESCRPPKTEIPVKVKKEGKMWEVDFSVTREQLKESGLCLDFSLSLEIYYIKLQDFLKK